MGDMQDQTIRQQCKALRMPTIAGQFAHLAEAAVREKQSHIGYLEALLAAEMEERESHAIARLLKEAKLPRMKTLEGFEFDRSGVSAAHLRDLAAGDYVTKAERSRSYWSAKRAPGRRIWRRGYAWPPAVSAGECGSPRRRR
jgi:DNA replication protein DnaC